MRRAVLVLSLLSVTVVVGRGPANAGATTFQYTKANTSCHHVCPYWMSDTWGLNTDLDGNGDPELYWDSCDSPTGSVLGTPLPPDPDDFYTYYEDKRVTAPSGTDFLVFEIFPKSDYDSYICATNGETLAEGTNILGENCANPFGDSSPIPFGCKEKTLIPVSAGTTYVLRVFNWADAPGSVAPLDARYEFVSF